MLDAENPYAFTWKISETSSQNELLFNFKFVEPQLISMYGSDKMIITMT